MADELVFYTNPMSRGRIVRWMLEEVGQPYHTELLEYGTTMKAPEYLRINPMGKVRPLEAAATNKAFGFEVPAERKAMAGYGSLADVLAVLEAAVTDREYLVGDRFSAADVYVGSHIGWGMRFGTIETRPAFERYFERLSARSAAIRAREIDDALVAEKTPATSG
jgi:glutathione S-transferase